jgi:hypothetical protein
MLLLRLREEGEGRKNGRGLEVVMGEGERCLDACMWVNVLR